MSDTDLIVRGLAATHAMMTDALGTPCPAHDARPYTYCFGSTASGVRGVCHSRLVRGFRDAARVVKAYPEPPLLAHTYTALQTPPRVMR